MSNRRKTYRTTLLVRALALSAAVALPGLSLGGCSSPPEATSDAADTPEDLAATSRLAARVHFAEGWTAIMDEGRWTVAEAAFRAAAEADPDWVLGRTLVGRITTDLAEREEILAWVEERLPGVDPTSRLLADVYVLNLRSANLRQKILLCVDHPNQPRSVQTKLLLSVHYHQSPPWWHRRV